MPRSTSVHGAWMEHAHARGNRNRRISGEPIAGCPIPDVSPEGAVDASDRRLLPRWTVRDASGRREPLQHLLRAWIVSDAEERSRRVPQVTLIPGLLSSQDSGPRA